MKRWLIPAIVFGLLVLAIGLHHAAIVAEPGSRLADAASETCSWCH